jgi:hypothetical protein
MSTGESKPSSSATRPTGRWAVFGLPPLLDSEERSDYERLYAGISEAVRPGDILEAIWSCEIADLTWEILRLRRMKAKLIDASAIKRFYHGPGEQFVERFDAQTLSQDLDHIEQIEHMTAVAEARRNNALREIERHRATFSDVPGRNVQQIEEGQIVDAESVEESDRA